MVGSLELIAADGEGGILRYDQPFPLPASGSILSLTGTAGELGPTRLIAKARYLVDMRGTEGQHFYVQWLSITALEHCGYLAHVLNRLGVKVHLGRGAGPLEEGVEVVYDPGTQQVRFVALRPGFERQPTARLSRPRSLTLADIPGRVMVETAKAKGAESWRALVPSDDPSPEEAATGRRVAQPGSYRMEGRALEARSDSIAQRAERKAKAAAERRDPTASPRRRRITTPRRSHRAAVLPEDYDPQVKRPLTTGRFQTEAREEFMLCDRIGARSLSFRADPTTRFEVGQPIRVGVPGDPLFGRLLWVVGHVEGYETDSSGDRRVHVRLEVTTVGHEYRRLLEHFQAESAI